MIQNEWMGLALLGIAWVTAFMVALDALIDAKAMWARLAAWKTTLVQGTVAAGELATHEVEQRVKQLDGDTPGLIFYDRSHVSRVAGGAVSVGTESVAVIAAKGAEVWIDEATRLQAAACPSAAEFDRLERAAQAAGGGLRTVKTSVRAGQAVWLAGTRNGGTLEASLVANFDPRTWAKARLTGIAGVVVLNFAWVAAGTVLALWPPVFGTVSIGGAIVLIGHFLGMTPIAMAAREKSRAPAIAFIRGEWKREGVASQPVIA